MVVDDEEDIQLLFQQRFRREVRSNRVALHFASSSEAALAYLTQPRGIEIILILSDINMPGMDGLELLQAVKIHYPNLTVFMLTAYDDAHHYQTAMQYGADDYFTKPIDFDALKQKIRQLSHMRTVGTCNPKQPRLKPDDASDSGH